MELLGMAYLANDRQGSKIVVASGEGVAQPPEEQRVVSHDPSVRSPRVRQSLFFVSSHTHTHTGRVATLTPHACQSLMHLWFSVVAFRRRRERARTPLWRRGSASFFSTFHSTDSILLALLFHPAFSFRGARFSYNRAQASPDLLHPIGSRFFLIFPLAFFCFL